MLHHFPGRASIGRDGATARSDVRRWLVRAALVAAALVGLMTLAVVLAVARLNGNIRSEPVEDQLGERPPVSPSIVSRGSESSGPGVGVPRQRALNILLIGSDTRGGGNASYGAGIRGARSDVTILLHLSADRQRAVAISIPRDSIVALPSCRGRNGGTTRPGLDLFNAAYARGGSACVIRTVERLTKIYIDHHLVIDFEGFRRVVDALGTVRVCVPRDVDDAKSGLRLSGGWHEVGGETALAYVRNRSLEGSGDIGRIRRQQAFLRAVVEQASSRGTLVNPKRLYQVLDAATRSVTTDPGLASLDQLRELAQQVQAIGPKQVRFVTVPWRVYPRDPNRVQWTPQAEQLWRQIREDRPLPASAGRASSTVGGSANRNACT